MRSASSCASATSETLCSSPEVRNLILANVWISIIQAQETKAEAAQSNGTQHRRASRGFVDHSVDLPSKCSDDASAAAFVACTS